VIFPIEKEKKNRKGRHQIIVERRNICSKCGKKGVKER
jgi:hypothetical protein